MRSTGFVVLSITVHMICIAALAMTPIRTIGPDKPGENIEVRIGEPAPKPGAEEAAPASKADLADEVAPPKKTAAKKSVKKPKALIARAKVEVKEKAEVKKSEEATQEPPSEERSDESAEEVLTPVKETPPVGVEAADEVETEAISEDVQKTDDPAPVAANSGDDAGSANDSPKKGGAAVQGAVSYLDLKQATGNKPPQYPMQARLEKRQGLVELRYRVTNEGLVSEIQLIKSSGYKDLDNEAIRAIAAYRFVPGQEGWATHPVNFTLKGPATELPARLRSKSAQAND